MKYDLRKHRKKIAKMLGAQGFRFEKTLPTQADVQLRPMKDIARRLLAIKCLTYWVCTSRKKVDSTLIRKCVFDNNLDEVLSKDEMDILRMTREDAQKTYANDINWKFENAWPLAWILGFAKELDTMGYMIERSEIMSVLFEDAPTLDDDLDQWLERQKPVDELEVVIQDDIYACLNNAAKNAFRGNDTVREGFDPITNGTVVRERRRALSWSLRPGSSWDEVGQAN